MRPGAVSLYLGSPMTRSWDLVVIGTGFGGSMVALAAVRAGLRVLLIERGRWVDRDDSAWDARSILIDRKYRSASPFETPRAGFGRTRFFPDKPSGASRCFTAAPHSGCGRVTSGCGA